MSMRRAAALLITALALSAGASTAGAHNFKPATARSVETQLNGARAAHGCGPLELHAGLSRAAGQQARLLLTLGELDHDAGTPFAQRVFGAAPAANLAGENLAWGYGRGSRAVAIVRSWLNSPPHRAILLDCRFTQLGVGIASGRFGDQPNATVYAADFAD
jgi:uncharacterized protein YkwD